MHFLVVADSLRARFFTADALITELTEVETLVHPESVAAASDLVSSQEGRNFPSGRDLNKEAGEVFARDIARTVEHALNAQAFERLIVAAPPAFLGQLRQALPNRVRRTVVAELNHDWTKVPIHDLAGIIRNALPETAGLPD